MSEYIQAIDNLLRDITNEVYSVITENTSLRKVANRDGTVDSLDLVRQNEILVKEKQRLTARLRKYEPVESSSVRSRKAGEPTFPWDDFPDVLQRATEMYLNSVKENDIQTYVENATGITRPSGRPINARFTNGSPPEFLNARVLDSGPTSWVELWKIGSAICKKRWQLMLLKSIGAYDTISDGKQKLPTGLLKMNPNDLLTKEQISLARRLYQEKAA